MSHAVDGRYDFYTEQLRCAAKPHRCSACVEEIARGHRYYVVSWRWEGEVHSVKRCLKCQEIHEHLRGLGGGDMWPAERLDCGEEYREHWGCQPPEQIAALAFMTQDESQAALAPEVSP